jgi:hypothetical protein
MNKIPKNKDSINYEQDGHKTSHKEEQKLSETKTMRKIAKRERKGVDKGAERSRMHGSTPERASL